MKSRKALLALAVAAAALGGCATYPYPYDNAYQNPDAPYYRDYYGRPYYGPAPYPGYYVAPSIGFGFTYSDRHYHHH